MLTEIKRGPQGVSRLCTSLLSVLCETEQCFLLQEPVEVIETMTPEEVRLKGK